MSHLPHFSSLFFVIIYPLKEVKELDVQIGQQLDECDAIVIGVSRHQQTLPHWVELVDTLQLPLDEWIKSGDIDLTVGACTVLPMLNGRVLCVGLDHRKQLDARKVAAIFEQVGQHAQQKKWRTLNIIVETFDTPLVNRQALCESAIQNIADGYYMMPHYQTFSNETDVCIEQLYFVTTDPLSLEATTKKTEAHIHFRKLADEPPNVLTVEWICTHIEQYCAQHDKAYSFLDRSMLEQLGFGALCTAYERDVRVICVNAKLTAQHSILATSMIGEPVMPLFSAVMQAVQHDLMGVFSIGTRAALADRAVITTMIGKTIELGTGAEARDLALVDMLSFAASQQVKTITSVAPLHIDHMQLYGEEAQVVFTNHALDIDATVLIRTKKPSPSMQADVLVKRHTTGRTIKRGALYHLFASAPWCHIELPVDARKQSQSLEVRFRNLFKEETT